MLVTDDLLATNSCRWCVESATPRNVARLLRRLDALRHTVLALRADEDQQLVICGGAGRFMVCATTGPRNLFELVRDPPSEARRAMLNIGGQMEQLPAERVLDRDTALTCALTYLYTAKLDARFNWRGP